MSDGEIVVEEIVFDITQHTRTLAEQEGDRIAKETSETVPMTTDDKLTLAAKIECAILGAVITELERRGLVD